MTTIRAMWPDGHEHVATTWRGLERAMREEQWHRYGRIGFRREMARRAMVWSGTRIHWTGSSWSFVHELERAGMLRLEEEDR